MLIVRLISIKIFNRCPPLVIMHSMVFVNLYGAAHSSGHTVALPVREPIEKKKVLRREKAAGRDPERMVTRREEGRAFHRECPRVAKDLDIYIYIFISFNTIYIIYIYIYMIYIVRIIRNKNNGHAR